MRPEKGRMEVVELTKGGDSGTSFWAAGVAFKKERARNSHMSREP